MTIELYFRRLGKLYETAIISDQKSFTGMDLQTFKVVSGSRMVLFINITDCPGGTTVQVEMENGADKDKDFKLLSSNSYTAPGIYTLTFSDIHMFCNLVTTVTGGAASYSIGCTLADNKSDAVVLDGFDPAAPSSVLTVGSDDGTATGTKYGFVNNLRQQIMAAHDVQSSVVWGDFGTTQERPLTITYTSATFPGHTVTRTFTYSLVGGKYRLDDDDWSTT